MSSTVSRLLVLSTLACAGLAARPLTAAGPLKLYFIDVEGGQSTLVVTPAGESLLVDAGYAGEHERDPRRILAAAKDAGVTRIDYLLLTHFHGDHVGGVPELARLIAIGAVIDHDTAGSSEPQVVKPFNALLATRKRIARHIVPRVGDRLPLQGVDAVVVSSAGTPLASPLPGAGGPNASCSAPARPAAEKVENPRSTGFRLQAGGFRFLDLGDLSGAPLRALVCPNDLVGRADVYLVPHHGNDDVADPATFAAFQPRVAIVNNGPSKGGGAGLLGALHDVPSADVWQLHRADDAGAANFPDDRIANLDKKTAHWIKVVAAEDGSFTVTNGRTGATKRYAPRL